MSCFIRHMIRKGIFYDMGIPASEENADKLEEEVAIIVAMKGHDCARVWAKVSQWLEDPKRKEILRSRLLQIYKSS